MSPALQSLLAGVVDYAGLFPPAALSLHDAIDRYQRHRQGPHAWMLGRFVVDHGRAAAVPPSIPLSVLASGDYPGAQSIETKEPRRFSSATYCEVPLAALPEVQAAGAFAKIRTGGIAESAIPSAESVAAFLTDCARLRVPWKATAGLHHPIRGSYPLTRQPGSAHATMHGFVNLLMAAAMAWHGASAGDVVNVLQETGAGAFHFNGTAAWRGYTFDLSAIETTRRDFFHSFGSCSFDEPVDSLIHLGLLS